MKMVWHLISPSSSHISKPLGTGEWGQLVGANFIYLLGASASDLGRWASFSVSGCLNAGSHGDSCHSLGTWLLAGHILLECFLCMGGPFGESYYIYRIFIGSCHAYARGGLLFHPPLCPRLAHSPSHLFSFFYCFQ